jgi:sugar (pentulose or hexulose) kinase
VGCAVLRQQGFTTDELIELSASMDPTTDSQYDYYPLVSIGERFPVADASKAPVLDPKPDSRSEYLKGLLQGIARVEAQGYQTLRHLGAEPAPRIVQTAGGGSGNEMWTVLRQRLLTDALRGRSGTGFDDNEDNATVVVQRADHTEASYGAALLAASTFINTD